jgi:uncharacterized membrane protein YkoI
MQVAATVYFVQIDKSKAISIGLKFFEQQNSDVSLKDAVLEDNVWIVTVSIGIMNPQTRQVRIDANSGQFLTMPNY